MSWWTSFDYFEKQWEWIGPKTQNILFNEHQNNNWWQLIPIPTTCFKEKLSTIVFKTCIYFQSLSIISHDVYFVL